MSAGKRRTYSTCINYKLSALEYLKFASVEKTAKEFKVDSKRIREWRESKKKLEDLKAAGESGRKQLPGAGRRPHSEELEKRLVQWKFSKREERLRVSRKIVRRKAIEFGEEEQESFVASIGWLQKLSF